MVRIDSNKIQEILYKDCNFKKSHKIFCPNVFAYEWESDFIAVTRAAFVIEYEIKISLSDFRLDFKKYDKHSILKTGMDKEGKAFLRPNFFWYAAPENVIPIQEIPKYAGFITVRGREINVVRKAPSLHRDKITQPLAVKILKSFQYKYWDMRMAK